MCQFHILSCSSFQSWILRSETLFGTIEYSFPYLYLKFENKKNTDLLVLSQWNRCGILHISPSTCLPIGSTPVLSNPETRTKPWCCHLSCLVIGWPTTLSLSTCFRDVGPAWHAVWARRCHYGRLRHWLRGVGFSLAEEQESQVPLPTSIGKLFQVAVTENLVIMGAGHL